MSKVKIAGSADDVLAEVMYRISVHLIEVETNCRQVADQLEAKGVELLYKGSDAASMLRSLAECVHRISVVLFDEELVEETAKVVFGWEEDHGNNS